MAADQNTPAFAPASALTELAPSLSPANGNLARDGLSDPDAMVRIGALDMLENAPANQIWPLVSPLLSDPVRGVRFIFIVWLAAYANEAQERGDPKAESLELTEKRLDVGHGINEVGYKAPYCIAAIYCAAAHLTPLLMARVSNERRLLSGVTDRPRVVVQQVWPFILRVG